MKKPLVIFLCLAAMLSAADCARLKWKHDYKPQADLRKDYDDCQRDVRSWRRSQSGVEDSFPNPGFSVAGNPYGSGEDPFNEQVLINECLQNKGWYR